MKRQWTLSILVLILLASVACNRRGQDVVSEPTPEPAAMTAPPATAVPPTALLPQPTATPAITLGVRPAANAPVPPNYRPLYDQLKVVLDAADAKLGAPPKHPIVFGAELLPADSNRGTDLLRPETLPSIALYLDSLQALGVRGVKMSVQYPLLKPDFPNYARYLDFYRQVAAEIKKRDMVLTVQASLIFANTGYTNLPVSYAGLTFQRYEQQDRVMVQTILTNLHPDYLVVVAEPDTAARLTGIKELNDPAKSAEFVHYVLNGLDRGATKMGAGTGDWSPLAFTERYARDASVDLIVLHMYPVSKETFTRAFEMAAVARQFGKRVILDEAWLYKTMEPGGGDNVAASEEVFKRDAYSFWQPLDEEFLRVMVKMCDQLQIDFFSPFWSTFLFGYIDYNSQVDGLSYGQIRTMANHAALKNLQAGASSPTGAYYRDLIAAHAAR